MRRLLTLPRLWAAAVLLSVYLAVIFTWVYPADFWWHLRYGELTLQSGPPATDPFTFTRGGQPFAYGYWLSDVVFAWVYAATGLSAIVLLNALLFTCGYGLVMRAAWHASGGRLRVAAGVTLCAFLLSVENWAVRPQSLSVLGAGAALCLAAAYLTGALRPRWLTLLPLLMVVWANSHGAFLVGLVLLALAGAGALVQRSLTPAASVASPMPLVLASAASLAAAAVLTPLGLDLLPAALRVASDPSVRGYALEWAPTSLATAPGMVLGAVSLGTLAPLGAWLGGQLAQSTTEAKSPTLMPWLAYPTAALLAVLAVAALPFWRGSLPLAPAQRALTPPDMPWGAADALAAVPPRRVFSDMQWASYLAWRLPADRNLFIDTRFELFPPEQWEQYGIISGGLAPGLLNELGVGAVLAHHERQGPLVAWLRQQPDWRPLFEDHYSSAWVREP